MLRGVRGRGKSRLFALAAGSCDRARGDNFNWTWCGRVRGTPRDVGVWLGDPALPRLAVILLAMLLPF